MKATYIALLRGINLGSRARVAMADLRALVSELGHTDVQTYLQSGNVVFSSSCAQPRQVAADLERTLAAKLGVPAAVIVRTAGELARVAAVHPFAERQADPAKLHVAFLSESPSRQRADQLGVPDGGPEQLLVSGSEVYLHHPEGAGRSRLTTAFLERRLGVQATARNWKTVTALTTLSS